MTESQQTEDENTPAGNTSDAAAVGKGVWIISIVILLSLTWYLLADRFTPYTNQARVQAYVVGVAPKVSGVVTQVRVENNQRVDEGQPLFEIDSASYQIALEKAQSDLQSARRQVGAGSAGVEAARANLVSARANAVKAEQDYRRLQRLQREDPGTISVRRLEVSKSSLDQARAAVTARKADIDRAIEQMGGDDEASNAILKAALSAVARAELDLGNTVVKASSAGVITDLRTDVGQFASTGKTVMTLIAIHDVWIDAEFTENNLGHIRAGTPVEILLDAMPGRIFTGTVRSVVRGVSTGSQPSGALPSVKNDRDWLRQSQRFPVIIGFDVDQDENLRRHLRVGGQASVMAFSDGHGFLGFFGKAYMRLMSVFSYAY